MYIRSFMHALALPPLTVSLVKKKKGALVLTLF